MVRVSETFLQQITLLAKDGSITVNASGARGVNAADPIDPQDWVTKQYLDGYIAATNEWSEVLSLGNTSGGTDPIISNGDILRGEDGYDLVLETTGDGYLVIQKDGAELARFDELGSSRLLFNGTGVVETKSSNLDLKSNYDIDCWAAGKLRTRVTESAALGFTVYKSGDTSQFVRLDHDRVVFTADSQAEMGFDAAIGNPVTTASGSDLLISAQKAGSASNLYGGDLILASGRGDDGAVPGRVILRLGSLEYLEAAEDGYGRYLGVGIGNRAQEGDVRFLKDVSINRAIDIALDGYSNVISVNNDIMEIGDKTYTDLVNIRATGSSGYVTEFYYGDVKKLSLQPGGLYVFDSSNPDVLGKFEYGEIFLSSLAGQDQSKIFGYVSSGEDPSTYSFWISGHSSGYNDGFDAGSMVVQGGQAGQGTPNTGRGGDLILLGGRGGTGGEDGYVIIGRGGVPSGGYTELARFDSGGSERLLLQIDMLEFAYTGTTTIKTGDGDHRAIDIVTGENLSGNSGFVSIQTGTASGSSGSIGLTVGAGGIAGDITLQGGAGSAGEGSSIYLNAGFGTGGAGGNIGLTAGQGNDSFPGWISITAGRSLTTYGGALTLTAGRGATKGGDVILNSGKGDTLNDGYVIFKLDSSEVLRISDIPNETLSATSNDVWLKAPLSGSNTFYIGSAQIGGGASATADVELFTGTAAASNSGNIKINTGTGNVTSSGDISITTGIGSGTGDVNIGSGTGSSSSGDINVTTGLGPSAGSGSITLTTGDSAGNSSGDIILDVGSANSAGIPGDIVLDAGEYLGSVPGITDGYIIFKIAGNEVARWDQGGSSRLLFAADDDAVIELEDNVLDGSGRTLSLIAPEAAGIDGYGDGYVGGGVRLVAGDGSGSGATAGAGGNIQLVSGSGGTGTASSPDGNVEFWVGENRALFVDGSNFDLLFDQDLTSATVGFEDKTSGNGSNLNIRAQRSYTGAGGDLYLESGFPASGYKSGNIYLQARASNYGTGAGGEVQIKGGHNSLGDGGDVEISGGTSTSDVKGSVVLRSGTTNIASMTENGAVTWKFATISEDLSQNYANWNPTNWDIAYHVRFSSTGSTRTISGFEHVNIQPIKIITNVDDTANITLVHEASSDSDNQITSHTGADYDITPGNSVTIIYDDTSQKWRIVSTT